MKLFLFLLLLLLPSFSFSQEVTIAGSWTVPILKVDGSVLSPLEIKEYKLYHSVDSPIDLAGQYLSTTTNSAEIVLDLTQKVEPYVVRIVVVVTDVYGGESAPSNELMQEFSLLSTSPPIRVETPSIIIRCGTGCVIEVK